MVNFEVGDRYYSTVSILGQCWNGFAIVHLAKHVPSGIMVAIKRYNVDKARDDASLVQVRSSVT